jgi:hypothetical protein
MMTPTPNTKNAQRDSDRGPKPFLLAERGDELWRRGLAGFERRGQRVAAWKGGRELSCGSRAAARIRIETPHDQPVDGSQRSTAGSPKGLTPKTCKRRRRC